MKRFGFLLLSVAIAASAASHPADASQKEKNKATRGAQSQGQKDKAVRGAQSQVQFGVDMAQRGLWSEALFRFRQAERLGDSRATVLNNVAVAYEVTGSVPGLAAATASLPAGGRLVLIGLHERPREVDLRAITLAEQEVIGTNAHSCTTDLPEALRMLAARRRDWRDVAPIALSLDRLVEDGIRPLVEGRSDRIKTLVDPWAATSRETIMTAPAVAAGS